jgi:hypothetical protein
MENYLNKQRALRLSWLQTASAGFPNWESCARRGFGKAKLAVMCRTRLKAQVTPAIAKFWKTRR